MIQRLLDVIAPESCLECGTEGSIWCEWCRLQHDPLPSRCFLCHSQTDSYKVCKNCKRKTNLTSVYVFGEYKENYKELVTALKFDCKRHAGAAIAWSMHGTLPYMPHKPTLIAVPSSPLRVRQRGFDHSVTLVKEVAKLSGLPHRNVLARTNDLRQVGASKKQRQEQIQGAFRLKRSRKEIPEHVILVDDVITTGATLSEAAKILKDAGVKQVDALTFVYSK